MAQKHVPGPATRVEFWPLGQEYNSTALARLTEICDKIYRAALEEFTLKGTKKDRVETARKVLSRLRSKYGAADADAAGYLFKADEDLFLAQAKTAMDVHDRLQPGVESVANLHGIRPGIHFIPAHIKDDRGRLYIELKGDTQRMMGFKTGRIGITPPYSVRMEKIWNIGIFPAREGEKKSGFSYYYSHEPPRIIPGGGDLDPGRYMAIDVGEKYLVSAFTYEKGVMDSFKFNGMWLVRQNRLFNEKIVEAHREYRNDPGNPLKSRIITDLKEKKRLFIAALGESMADELTWICREKRIGTVIMGDNGAWRTHSDYHRFVPLNQFGQLFLSFARAAREKGIDVHLISEKNSSKFSALDIDLPPGENGSGRIDRDTFVSPGGDLLDSDINAAANILQRFVGNKDSHIFFSRRREELLKCLQCPREMDCQGVVLERFSPSVAMEEVQELSMSS